MIEKVPSPQIVDFKFFCDDDFVKESSGPKFAMFFTVTPVAERVSIAWTYVAKDYENILDEETRQFEDMITWQDVPIVESQRPELLPLDLQAELHLRSDRTAIAYRKWLRELGLTFGTA
jgi:phenylpropionate dioxygenase-like ring-hydroxylating dioxygenase large terminal subunit